MDTPAHRVLLLRSAVGGVEEVAELLAMPTHRLRAGLLTPEQRSNLEELAGYPSGFIARGPHGLTYTTELTTLRRRLDEALRACTAFVAADACR